MKNKTGLIIGREYFSRVKKKSFLLTTILVPLVILAFYAIIIAVSFKDSAANTLAVIDEAGLLQDSSNATIKDIVFIKNETEAGFTKKYKQQGFDAFLYIPKFNINDPENFRLHSNASVSLSMLGSTEKRLNKAIQKRRLKAQGINPDQYEKIGAEVSVDNILDSEKGGKKGEASSAYIISFVCGILIYMMMMIYGTQVMRGVSEEKTNRIAEVIVSSVKPFQLMVGKIIGIGAVGLTQFLIWIVIMVSMQFIIPLIFPEMIKNMNSDTSAAGAVITGFSSLPLLKIGIAFMFYFLAGYLTYASLFAAIGSMTTDDQQDTQQLVFPVLMPIILGFVIMTKAINDPYSNLAVFGSIFPLTSPIVMMGRITYDIPAWQLITSVLLLILSFIFFAWVTAKIYRTGILMYGKKATWKEMIKWAVKG
jgi:ABC-2 type transport system permease protein